MKTMTYDRAASRTDLGRRHPVQLAAAAVGGVFLLVGILGFVPGVTTNYDQLSFAGHESGALLLGVFAVSVLHNLVHAAFGVAGLVLSRTRSGAKNYLVVGGIVYAVLWLYGLLIDHGSAANFVPVNGADNWLHLVLAVAMIALGVLLARDTHGRTTG
jgi:arginine exporter protein ArgO